MEQDLGVRLAVKVVTLGPETFAQLEIVVDLAVVRDDEVSLGQRHRLLPSRREIENGETSMSERTPPVGRGPVSLPIGTAVRQHVRHGANGVNVRAFGCEDARDAAHARPLGVALAGRAGNGVRGRALVL